MDLQGHDNFLSLFVFEGNLPRKSSPLGTQEKLHCELLVVSRQEEHLEATHLHYPALPFTLHTSY